MLGCGPIGILLVQSLKAFGAAEVMATDISDYRLELARTCGADYAVNTKTRPFGAALTEPPYTKHSHAAAAPDIPPSDRYIYKPSR